MAAKVYLHVGLPKTATTYLPTIRGATRATAGAQGVPIPGEARHDHLWSSRIVREDPLFEKANEHRQGAWQRILADLAAWPATGVISHEFFAAASADQAARMVADLAPA